METQQDFIDYRSFVNLSEEKALERLKRGDVTLGTLELDNPVNFPIVFVSKTPIEREGKEYVLYQFALDGFAKKEGDIRVGLVNIVFEKNSEHRISLDHFNQGQVPVLKIPFQIYYSMDNQTCVYLEEGGDKTIRQEYSDAISVLKGTGIIPAGENIK